MEPSVPNFLIPNKLCNQAGIAAVWHSSNELTVFPTKPVFAISSDGPSVFAPVESAIFNVRKHVVLFHPILRKLVNEANGTFLAVQETVASPDADVKGDLLKLSLQYRSIIRACLEDLQEEIIRCEGEQRDDIENFITIFYSVECVWHLCEILFVDVIPGNLVLPHLLDWVRFHFPKYERKAAVFLSSEMMGLESDPDYWETVIGALMQGRIEIVRSLLKLHTAANTKPFQLADQTLKAMPIYSVFGGMSAVEFKIKWKHWLVDTQSKIDGKLFFSEKHLNLIMRVAVGEEAALSDVQAQCEAWYELLAAWLFFTEPAIKSFELGQFANKCVTKMGRENRLKHLDKVLLAAMENDLNQVIKEVQHMFDNNWLAAHLTDLIYHAGKLDETFGRQVREAILLDYGSLLMGHSSLWQVGLSYLDHCPRNGLNAIELLIPRIPLGTVAKTQKIIKEAKKRDLTHIIQSICKIQGMYSLQRGRVGNALTWALKSQDGYFATYLADKFLVEYSTKGTLSNTDLLHSLGSSMLVSDRLIFLGKYCEFHKLYNSRNYKEAADVLISLLSSKLTPKYFWVTLLMDAVPLLECDDSVLNSNDTYSILHFLEEKGDTPEMKDKIDIIRLAVARNLGRCSIMDAQCF